MRIALVARPATGGLRAHVFDLLRFLDREKFDVSLVAPALLLESLPGDLASTDSYPFDLRANFGLSDLFAATRLAALAPEFDLFHAHGVRAGFICALTSLIVPLPYVVTFHNIPPRGAHSRLLLRLIVGRAAATIGVSKAIAERVDMRTMTVSNGVDLRRFEDIDRDTARAAYELNSGQFVVATAARLSPEKGVDILLGAAAQLEGVSFLIAGNGPLESSLRSQATANVRFLGRHERIPQFFAAADCVAVPSRSEGQGIVVLEAFAAGTPVIASDVGGLPEIVQNNETGILVPVGSVKHLVAAIKLLRDDLTLRETLGNRGKARARHYDIRSSIRVLEGVYAEVASKRSGIKL